LAFDKGKALKTEQKIYKEALFEEDAMLTLIQEVCPPFGDLDRLKFRVYSYDRCPE
jgi:hypothetical protein